MSLLLDNNILLRIANGDDLQHLRTVEAVNGYSDTGKRLVLCTQDLIEFWAVATRPFEANGYAFSCDNAYQEVERFRRTAELLADPSDLFEHWSNLVRT